MKLTNVKDIFTAPNTFAEKQVTVGGWVRTVRDSKVFGFIELNDGSYFKSIQVVIDNKLENFSQLVHLNVGSSVVVTGKLVLTPDAKQAFEIKAENVKIKGESAPDYPLQKKRHSLEFLRTIAYLRPRTNTFSAVFRVRSEAAYAIHKFFNERGFVYAHTPIITGSDCEGAGEMFRITTLDMENPPRDDNGKIDYTNDFFGREASLTVSGQLEAETFALAFGKTYTFGPTFRAENSNTARHAAEFWMIEPEIAFADLNDDMELAEAMVKFVIRHVLDNCKEEMAFFNQFIDKGLVERLEHVANSDFGVMEYAEGIKILEQHKDKFEYPVFFGCDLQTEHERFLTEEIMKKPMFLINYPKEIKAFYMRQNDDQRTVAAMDLFVPGIGELIGGSQREERYDVLLAKMEEMGLNNEDYDWYLNLRRYGGVSHAGYGLGFERLIMYLTGISNIRDVLPFPRCTGKLL